MHCEREGAGAKKDNDRSSHGSPKQPMPDQLHSCQPMAACATGVIPAVGSVVAAPPMDPGSTAIERRIQVLASLTFPPEPPPPKA